MADAKPRVGARRRPGDTSGRVEREEPVAAVEIDQHELARLGPLQAQVVGRGVGVVEDHVVVIAPADRRRQARDRVALGDLAGAAEHFDEDHFVHVIRSRYLRAKSSPLS